MQTSCQPLLVCILDSTVYWLACDCQGKPVHLIFAFFDAYKPTTFLRAAWRLASLISFPALAAQTSENTHQATARRASGANKIWVSQAAAGTVPKLIEAAPSAHRLRLTSLFASDAASDTLSPVFSALRCASLAAPDRLSPALSAAFSASLPLWAARRLLSAQQVSHASGGQCDNRAVSQIKPVAPQPAHHATTGTTAIQHTP